MNLIATKILNNKPDYLRNLKYLDEKYNSIFTRKLEKENNEINVLSLFCEMEFGYLLNEIFDDVIYEPKIKGKTPDWLVISNNQKIIFEVRKINPIEDDIQQRIDLAKKDDYFGLTQTLFSSSRFKFLKHIHKITQKEETYRELIQKENYLLVICIDVINLHNEFIEDTDLKDYLDFSNKNSLIGENKVFCQNTAGIIGKPIFPKNIFIKNENAKYKLNDKNIKLLEELI